MNDYELSIVLLAAGSSSRMGTSKQLLKIGNITLLEHAIQCAVESAAENTLIVLGAEVNQHRAAIQHLPVAIEVNADWAIGIGNSLKFGVHKVLELWPETQALIVMVCDQPKLTTHHVNALIDVWRKDQPLAVASEYSDTTGVPALFDRAAFSDLLNISNSRGAREVLEKLDHQLIRVLFAGGEIDLDTPVDYQTYLKKGKV